MIGACRLLEPDEFLGKDQGPEGILDLADKELGYDE